MGRAQVVQAECARVTPSVDMNPILLKPSEDNLSQVVIHGKSIGHFSAHSFYDQKQMLWQAICQSYQKLKKEDDKRIEAEQEKNLKIRKEIVAKISDLSKLSQWLQQVTDKHPPAGLKNRAPKLNYMTQEEEEPINFKIYGAHTKFLHWSYKRYMERDFRHKYGFEGTAIKFWFFEKHDTHKHGRSPTKD
jgi:predicted GTPase